jgi:hypothetical protein
MSASKYKIEIDPRYGDGYFIKVYFPDQWGEWIEMYEHRGTAETYWGARCSAWWRKVKIDNGWIRTKKVRVKETVYEE